MNLHTYTVRISQLFPPAMARTEPFIRQANVACSLCAILAATDVAIRATLPKNAILAVHVWENNDLAAGYIIRTDESGNLSSIE